MIELQELQILLALARHGSALAAGRKLRMSHTTVLRTVAAIEAKIGYAIFVRTPERAIPTPEGNELLQAARAVEQTMHAARRRFMSLDGRIAGIVRLATNVPLAELLLPALNRLRERTPALTVDLLINQTFVELSGNYADVAVRHVPANARREHPVVFGRTLASAPVAYFGSAEYFARRGGVPEVLDLTGHDVIDYRGHEFPGAGQAAEGGDRANHFLTTNSAHVALAAVIARLGVSALPCYLGRLHGLVQFGPLVERSDICVLLASDMEHVPRIQIVVDAVAAACAEGAALIAGEPISHLAPAR